MKGCVSERPAASPWETDAAFHYKKVLDIPVVWGYFAFDHFSCCIGLKSTGTVFMTGVEVVAMSQHDSTNENFWRK